MNLLVFVALCGVAAAGVQVIVARGFGASREFHAGDVVWAEMRFEERRDSKDRPVVVVGRRGPNVLVLKCTTQTPTDRHGRLRAGYVSIGSGEWDRQRRHSWVDCRRTETIKTTQIRRRAGAVDPRIMRQLRREQRRQRS